MPWIIDAHEDLAYNMLTFGRDYRSSVEIRRTWEAGTEIPSQAGQSLLGWPEYQRGQIAVIFSTIFVEPERYRSGPFETQVYRSFEQAERLYRAQFDAYKRLAGDYPDMFRLVLNRKDLAEVIQAWEDRPGIPDPPQAAQEEFDPAQAREKAAAKAAAKAKTAAEAVEDLLAETFTNPVGLVLSMEGAEGLARPEMLEEFWEMGLRAVGPVWAGTRLFGGTKEPGDMTREGQALLEIMAALGYTLDIAHMNDRSAQRALDVYPGAVIASHANVRALLHDPFNERHLTDEVIRTLCERDGVIGVVPYNRFLKPGWGHGDDRSRVHLEDVVAHIDYICQIAGDALHAGIGSDFDGGFGLEGVPAEINDVSDLQKLAPVLKTRGYTPQDIANILGGNWRRHLERTLPAS